MGRKSKREREKIYIYICVCVCVWLIHFAVQWKLIHYKATILQ